MNSARLPVATRCRPITGIASFPRNLRNFTGYLLNRLDAFDHGAAMKQPSFGLIGLSYREAPVSVREQLSLDADALSRLEADVRGLLIGLAVVKTCNRVEFYGESQTDEPAVASLRAALSGIVPLTAFESYLYEAEGMDAAHHLARVAAGLDSMVLGEPQILGQVGEALQRSEMCNLAGEVLGKVFQSVLTTGKRARQETALGRRPVSVASVAVDHIRRVTGPLHGCHVAILGLGETGQLVAKILNGDSIGQLTFINRDPRRAQELALQACAQAVPLEELRQTIRVVDVLVCATNAPHTVIEPAHIGPRDRHPLLLIDLAVPRDVDPEVATLADVTLINVDALRQGVDVSLSERRTQVPYVEAIVEEEMTLLGARLKSMAVEPVIGDVRRKAEAIRQAELQRLMQELEPISPELARKLDYFSHSLINKLLHEPTRQLRHHVAQNGDAEHAAGLIRDLFAVAE